MRRITVTRITREKALQDE